MKGQFLFAVRIVIGILKRLIKRSFEVAVRIDERLSKNIDQRIICKRSLLLLIVFGDEVLKFLTGERMNQIEERLQLSFVRFEDGIFRHFD